MNVPNVLEDRGKRGDADSGGDEDGDWGDSDALSTSRVTERDRSKLLSLTLGVENVLRRRSKGSVHANLGQATCSDQRSRRDIVKVAGVYALGSVARALIVEIFRFD